MNPLVIQDNYKHNHNFSYTKPFCLAGSVGFTGNWITESEWACQAELLVSQSIMKQLKTEDDTFHGRGAPAVCVQLETYD